jgi:hypothetical protein
MSLLNNFIYFQKECDGWDMWHVRGNEGGIQSSGTENKGGKIHLEDLDVDIRTIVKLIYKKYDVAAWSGLIWLTSRTTERLF